MRTIALLGLIGLTGAAYGQQQIWDDSIAVTGVIGQESELTVPPYSTSWSNTPLSGNVDIQLVLNGPANDPVLQSVLITEPSGAASVNLTNPTYLGINQTYALGDGANMITLNIGPTGFTSATILEGGTSGNYASTMSFNLTPTSVLFGAQYGSLDGHSQDVDYSGGASNWHDPAPTQVPELNGELASSALVLLLGVIAILRSRTRE